MVEHFDSSDVRKRGVSPLLSFPAKKCLIRTYSQIRQFIPNISFSWPIWLFKPPCLHTPISYRVCQGFRLNIARLACNFWPLFELSTVKPVYNDHPKIVAVVERCGRCSEVIYEINQHEGPQNGGRYRHSIRCYSILFEAIRRWL